jgi:glutathione S-transferase
LTQWALLSTILLANRDGVRLLVGYTGHGWELLGMWQWLPAFLAASIALGGGSASEAAVLESARTRLERIEKAIVAERGDDGPFFNGPELSLVDAAYAPFLQRFAFIEATRSTGLLADFPLVQAWSDALLADERISGLVSQEFPRAFATALQRRGALAAPLFADLAA